jgi:MtrB/PioB family decaheme-associated outer membrane protein
MFGRAGLDSSDMTLRPNATGASANGGWAVLLVPEPIDSSIRQLEAKLNFNRDKLALTGAYYGSFYANNNGSLSPIVPGTLNRGALWTNCATAGCSTVPQLASAAVALPPDNQAHQFYVTGNYAFTQDTRGNFKVSYAHATQNESFVGMGLTPATNAPANLGGVVDTKLAQVGLTSKVTSNLSVNGSLRYEDRADKTPKAVYNTSYGVPCGTTTAAVGSALNCTSNWPSGSQTRTSAKLDGVYRMISGYMLTVGGDWERKATPLPPDNTALFNAQVLFRSALVETGLHTEIRKSLSETLNGALGVEVKKRRGKDTGWVTTSGTAANTLVLFDPTLNVSASNRVLPDMYMDRDRAKLRGSLDWDASDKLLVQGVVEHSRDAYLRAYSEAYLATQVIPTVPGARTIMADSLSLESSYQASENWKVNGYWTRSYNRWNVNKASLGDDTKNTANTFGMGINGKLSPRITVGLALLTTRDNTSYSNLSATAVAGQAAGNVAGWVGQTQPGNTLPDIKYTTNKLNIQGNYAIDKASDVRLLLAYQEFKTDDWQWGYNGVPFLYSDNTTVSQPNQYLSFIGASYIIRY